MGGWRGRRRKEGRRKLKKQRIVVKGGKGEKRQGWKWLGENWGRNGWKMKGKLEKKGEEKRDRENEKSHKEEK